MTQQEIEARGLRVSKRGQAWAIVGPGVSLLVADLRILQPRDIEPTGDFEHVVLSEFKPRPGQ
jgi:hypothetical protein